MKTKKKQGTRKCVIKRKLTRRKSTCKRIKVPIKNKLALSENHK